MNILLHIPDKVDLISDSFSSEILILFSGIITVMWWVIRNWITGITTKLTGIQESIDALDEKVTDIDKRVTVNETKDEEIQKKVERLLNDWIDKNR